MDADADGKPDDGYSGNPAIAGLDGRNLPSFHDDALRYRGGLSHYGIGVVEFIRRLRAAFPAGKLLLADGMLLRNSRAFELLNGIESEGFPHLCAS